MLNKRFLFVLVMFMVLLWLSSPTAVFSTQPNLPDAPPGNGFTYQGFLKDASGAPIHSTCDFIFQLFDSDSGGTQIGSDSSVGGVSVDYGYFSTLVNAGDEFGAQPFNNEDARWLQIWVKCGGETGYTNLLPRQMVSETLPSHEHFGQTWNGSGTGLTLYSDSAGLVTISATNGVFGWAYDTSGETYGVYGESDSTIGYGVYGTAPVYGVYGVSSETWGDSIGVYGVSPSEYGKGVYGEATATSGAGCGVEGSSISDAGIGVYGIAYHNFSTNFGVIGVSASTSGTGVYGSAGNVRGINYGVYGRTSSTDGYAGYFDGPAHVNGTLTKGGGGFKIDHPLDPENQFLYHSFVESPEMKNVYDGLVTLDANGEAWVELPKWFEALNQNFRYQLTPIGTSMPDLFVAREILDNRFLIAGGEPGMKVSWQVTGVRHDPWAETNRIPVEQSKPPEQQGLYLHPELYGQPADQGIGYVPAPEASAPPE